MQVHTFTEQGNGYLIVSGGRSVLVDCPCADMAGRIRAAGLPLPEIILHTQVQEEYCREWSGLNSAGVYVFDGCQDVARRSAAFFADCVTRWPPSRPWPPETRGMEKYGLVGCVSERPPEKALNVVDVLQAGQTFRWQGLELEVIALPGSGKRAIGLYWRKEGTLFSGDLIHAGGYLVNLYDLERGYAISMGYEELMQSLRTAMAMGVRKALPSTGAAITDFQADAQALLARLDKALHPAPAGQGLPEPLEPRRAVGMFRQRAEGLYQAAIPGPMVLYIDDAGRGLCIEPDLCIWHDWDTSCRIMNEQMSLLEREAGLKRIEWALVNHPHGDHLQFCDLLRERYGTQIMAPPDVAVLMERPAEFNYPGLIPWYDFTFDHVKVDRRLAYDSTVQWHDVPVTTIRTTGHMWAHGSFVIPWHGLRTVCTSDWLQYSRGPIVQSLPCMYSDTAWPDRGPIPSYEKLLENRVDLVLGGHGMAFYDPDGNIIKTLCLAARQAQALWAGLLHDGDLMRAMTPPGFDQARARLDKAAAIDTVR